MAGVIVPGQLYVPSGADIREDILTDIELESVKFGTTPEVLPGGDNWIWANAHAQSLALLYSQSYRLDKALTPNDAEGEDLLRWKDALQLPDVPASVASGKIRLTVTGTATVPDGRLVRIVESGIRGRVLGTWAGVTDGAEIDIETVDTGEQSNTPGGSEVEFITPPANVAAKATVSLAEPLTGGTGEESEARLRERVLNRLAEVPGAGNVGHVRELAFNSSPAVIQCYVYPALGGPSSAKVVPLKGFDVPNNDYSRAFSTTALARIRTAIQSEMPAENQIVVQSAADESTDVAIQIEIPNAPESGGDGSGWVDSDPWPALSGGDTKVSVSVVTDSSTIRINAQDATPIAKQTHIVWWSPTTRKFLGPYLLASVSGSAGAWDVTTDKAMVDEAGVSVAVGDYISPASINAKSYGATYVAGFEALGPGENTSSSSILQSGRALRRPLVAISDHKAALTSVFLQSLHNTHEEITDASFAYRSTSTPTVPASVDTAPNVLVPRHFGLYPSS